MLDEKALRKPGFVEGHWTELADGQKWCFPKPRFRFKPVFVNGKVDVSADHTFGPEFDEGLAILLGIADVEPVERLRVKFDVIVRLLRSNYELTDEQVSSLIVLEPDDDASQERFNAVSNIIAGLAPKPPADTSDAPH